ncbi:MAG: LysM peptidoglycan-binding domain-containing protein [Clostridiales bacterium]|nr:LysM peptidoglycan-binding domain-containing protein [Clostridiales bacterium]
MKNNGNKKKYRIKSKSRFIISLIIMIGILVTAVNIATGQIISTALAEPQYTEVTVVSGDTLWDIANTYKSNDIDTRKAVYTICQINSIEPSGLEPGMTINVPQDL